MTAGCHTARSEFNTVGSIVRRACDPYKLKSLSKLAYYLTYAKLFRKEVHKKHGMRFGLHHATNP